MLRLGQPEQSSDVNRFFEQLMLVSDVLLPRVRVFSVLLATLRDPSEVMPETSRVSRPEYTERLVIDVQPDRSRFLRTAGLSSSLMF